MKETKSLAEKFNGIQEGDYVRLVYQTQKNRIRMRTGYFSQLSNGEVAIYPEAVYDTNLDLVNSGGFWGNSKCVWKPEQILKVEVIKKGYEVREELRQLKAVKSTLEARI